MRKFIYFFVFCAAGHIARAQTQSIIYDATAIMNAKYGVEALLIPKAAAGEYVIVNSISGTRDSGTVTPRALIQPAQSNAVIYEILRRNAGLPAGSTIAQITAAYAGNPFLNNIIPEAAPAVPAHLMETVGSFFISPVVGGVGHDILGNLVNGTADFLIKRAQEEISISVFEKFKAFISRYPEFDKLFPRTCALIKPVEAYEYNRALTAFKAAIKQDLDLLVSRISLLYDIPRYRLLNQKVPALTLLFSGTTLLSELNGEKNFAGSVQTLSQQVFLTEQNNYAGFLRILTILSNSLLDKSLADDESKTPAYIHREYIGTVTHNRTDLLGYLARIYLGLIWQHTQGINFTAGSGTQTFGQLLNHWVGSATIAHSLQIINQTLNTVQAVDEKLKSLKDDEANTSLITGRNEIKAKRFVIYAELINDALGLTDIYINPANVNVTTRIREIRQVWPGFTASVSDMIRDFHEGEYNLGIAKLEEVLTIISKYLNSVEQDKAAANALSTSFQATLAAQRVTLVASKTVLVTRITTLPAAGANAEVNTNIEAERQELTRAIAKLDEEIKQIDYQNSNRKMVLFNLAKIIKYMNLLAAVTKAENSKAVEKLLESYALPAGSSRIKKVSRFNTAVNAYVGAFFGRSGEEGEGFTNNYGLAAPIGFTVSRGLNKGGSFSLFAGVFDIGGTIRYKLDNQGKYQQDISLAGIVSPSIHLVYGFPWFLPLSIGGGWQWISPTTSASNKIDLKGTFNAFIAVDIPLFNLAGGKVVKR